MVKDIYVPKRGDIIWLEFTPQLGKEQSKRRPAIVLSPHIYNSKVGLCLCCPITSKVKKYPFEVSLPEDFIIQGVILADQIKSMDWLSRKAQFIALAPPSVINDTLDKIVLLLK